MQLFSEPKLTIFNSSAGSGKTYTLATEYIKFALQDEFNYKRILAITFTNKATAEMKERILNFLQTLSKNEDKALMDLMITKTELSEKDIKIRSKRVLSRILHDFGFFSVNTIDSFFQKLIKSFAAELNIYINYEVIIDTEEVVEWVVDEMLVRSYDDKKLKGWIEKYVMSRIDGNDSLFTIKSLFETISKELFNSTIKDKIIGNNQELDSIDKVQDLLKQINKLKTTFENQMNEFGEKGISILDNHTLSITDFNGKTSSAASLFTKILNENKIYVLPARVKSAYNDSSAWYTKQRTDLIGVVESELNPLLISIVDYHKENYELYVSANEVLKNIYGFGLTNYLEELKGEYVKENNYLLLGDSVQHISELIKENEDTPFVYDKIGAYYNFLLLDEAQDTSDAQWKNLLPLVKNSLAEQGEVIIVGDVKQSIYRWRGGDSNLLIEGIKTDVAPFGVKNSNLNDNYRSTKDVVETNNLVLEKSIQSLVDLGLTNLDKYYEGFIQNAKKEDSGYVEYTLIKPEKGEAKFPELSLNKSLSIIKELVKERNYTLQDIAILVRSNKESAKVAEFLKQNNIAILSSEALHIQNSRVIQFVISVLKLCIYFKDSISRGVIIRFLSSENELDNNLKGVRNDQLFNEFLTPEFASNHKEIANLSAYEAIEKVISIFGLQKKSPAYLVELLELTLEYSKRKSNSLTDFLAYWDDKIADGKKSINVPEGENAVSIVTVHKSKGLEYPVVIIPFATWKFTPMPGSMFWFNSDSEIGNKNIHFPVKSNKKLEESVFSEQYMQKIEENYFDEMNSLYVAITRAEKELYVNIQHSNTATNGKIKSWKDVSNISSLIQYSFNDYFEEVDELYATFSKGEKTNNALETKEKSITETPQSLQTVKSSSKMSLLPINDEEGVSQYLSEGRLMHTIFEDINDVSEIESAIEKRFVLGDIDKGQKEKFTKLIKTIFSISEIKNWFNSHYKIVSERDIYNAKDGRTYRPDKVFVSDDEVVIVDFKIHYNKEAEPKYKKQLANYKTVLTMLGYKNVKSYLLYVEDVELKEV